MPLVERMDSEIIQIKAFQMSIWETDLLHKSILPKPDDTKCHVAFLMFLRFSTFSFGGKIHKTELNSSVFHSFHL